jgi:hypothetical protein
LASTLFAAAGSLQLVPQALPDLRKALPGRLPGNSKRVSDRRPTHLPLPQSFHLILENGSYRVDCRGGRFQGFEQLFIGHRVPPGKGRGHRLQNLVGLTGATHPSQRGRRAGSPAATAILVSEVSQRLRQTRFDGGERRANRPAHVGDRGSSFRFRPPRGRCRWRARARLRCRSFDHQILHDALRDFAGRDHAPQPDEQFAGERHNHFRLACASTLPKDMKTCRKAHSVLTIGNSHIFRRWAGTEKARGAKARDP